MDEESALSVRHAPPTVADLAARLWAERPDAPVFVVGLTGGVACGKSTLARALTEALAALAPKPRVERVGADGFLFPNAVLSARGGSIARALRRPMIRRPWPGL